MDRAKNSYVIINILNWNQYETTLECLASIREVDYDNFEVVVIDNGSTDDSAKIISQAYRDIHIIRNKENLGCCEGRNVGIRYSLRKRPDYIFLLDNDTIVDKNILKELVKVAESDKRIGLVAPMVYYHQDRNMVWVAGGGRIDWIRGRFYDLGMKEIDNGQFREKKVEAVPEGFSFVRREVFETAGLIDPDFFYYYESGDWNTRIVKRGWRIVFASEAKIWHKYSFSHGNESPQFYYYRTRNRLLFMWKTAPRICLIIFFFYFIYDFSYNTLLTLYLSKKPRQIRAALIGILDFLRGKFGERTLGANFG